MAWIRDFLDEVDRQPDPDRRPERRRCSGEAWASWGLGQAMYDQGSWGALTDALREAKAGNGAAPHGTGQQLRRTGVPGGGYTGNIMEVMPAVNCLDRPDSPDLATYQSYEAKSSRRGADLGRDPRVGRPCRAASGRPRPDNRRRTRSAPRAATPSSSSARRATPRRSTSGPKRLRDQLANAVLVSYDGDGHTAYRRSNECIDNAIDAYYVQGRVPEDGLTC